MNLLQKITSLIKPKRYRYKSAVTGRWVSKAYADANPTTTMRMVRRDG